MTDRTATSRVWNHAPESFSELNIEACLELGIWDLEFSAVVD
jgi:hypothetical protein